MLALAALASLVIAPLPVAAAPEQITADEHDQAIDTDVTDKDDEPPLDTDDDDELPLDTDDDDELVPAPALDDDLDPDLDRDDVGAIDDGYNPLRDSPQARTARRWLGAGIAATATGAVLLGGGIAMAMTDPCDPLAGNNCFTNSRNHAALTMGVPGGVLLLGGVAMTVIGALQKRRLASELTGSVTAGRDHIGVVVVGRF